MRKMRQHHPEKENANLYPGRQKNKKKGKIEKITPMWT